MFIGEYKHNLDSKGRVAVPAKFRKILQEGAVVTKGLDNCLFVYSQEQWEKMAEKFASLPMSQSKARAFARHMLAGAMDVEFDNQGRITLPDYLRKFAGLDKKIVIAGLYDHLEIWDEQQWENYKQESEQNTNEIAEGLSDLGI